MPRADHVNMNWLRDILAGRKRLLKLSDVATVNVPRLNEFAASKLYKAAIDDAEAKLYLPDPGADGKRNISRAYLFNSKFFSPLDHR